MKGISSLYTVIFLIITTIAVIYIYSQFGERLFHALIGGSIAVSIETDSSETRDILIVTIRNYYDTNVVVTDVIVETESGTNPAIYPQLPISILPKETVVIVVGGDGKHWCDGKKYSLSIVYTLNGRENVITSSFTFMGG